MEYQEIVSNTTTVGAIFDTRNYDLGIYFALQLIAWTDGAFALLIEHGDDGALGDAAEVDAAMLVYGTLPSLGAAIAEGAELPAEGVHSTKRYVRASIVSTGVTSGAFAQVLIVKDAEMMKVEQA